MECEVPDDEEIYSQRKQISAIFINPFRIIVRYICRYLFIFALYFAPHFFAIKKN